jgi:hypothetical protein
LLFFFAGLGVISVSRIGLAMLVRRLVSSGLLSCSRVVVLADAGWLARHEIARNLERYGYIISRVFTIAAPDENTGGDASTADQIADVMRYIRQRCPDEVVLAFPWHRKALITRITHELRSVAAPARLLADPGQTPNVETMRRRVSFDLCYIESWSVWLDLRILAMTAVQVLRDRNAY